MRKNYLSVALVLVLAGSMMFSSCIGSFQLTNKVLAWNKQVGSKFVNELVFFAFWVLPVYEISSIADLLVLNSIEFWSGRSPLSAETKVIDGKDARYEVRRDLAGYTITNLSSKEVVRFDFSEADNSWSVSADGKTVKFMQFVDDTHVRMIAPDGSLENVEISQEGVYAYQQMAAAMQYAAM
ncbi:MAG: DUF3332 domain-containing protein [Muribaculaceae bacterium]